MRYTLCVKLDKEMLNEEQSMYYENYKPHHLDDSGVDLPTAKQITVGPGVICGTPVDFGISCTMIDNERGGLPVGFYLYPRSSFHKTPLMMANCVGIIDAGYRGPIKGMVKLLPPVLSWTIERNQKLFQVCAPNLEPFEVKVVETLPDSSRGTGGFGSTS